MCPVPLATKMSIPVDANRFHLTKLMSALVGLKKAAKPKEKK